MVYDFDEIISRKHTDSVKYDGGAQMGVQGNVLPMWVADMDFRAPEVVLRALKEKCEHGVLGYPVIEEDYSANLRGWFADRYGWEIEDDWVVVAPGVVYAICTAIRALTEPGDPVLIQQPVYHLFEQSVLNNGRRLVVNELQYEGGRYTFDFWDFERKIINDNIKLFVLCSPHNPVGRVWTESELVRIGEICSRHGVVVVADEIHADFVYGEAAYRPFANLRPAFADFTITCTAPTKSFNFPGLHVSNVIIQNAELRNRFAAEIAGSGQGGAGLMGIVACRAAYGEGGEWLDALNQYLEQNARFLYEFFRNELPQVSMAEQEGTYLAWLNFSALGMEDRELAKFCMEKAGLWLSPGYIFGQGGSGFMRLNFGCPRSMLEQAADQLSRAVKSL